MATNIMAMLPLDAASDPTPAQPATPPAAPTSNILPLDAVEAPKPKFDRAKFQAIQQSAINQDGVLVPAKKAIGAIEAMASGYESTAIAVGSAFYAAAHTEYKAIKARAEKAKAEPFFKTFMNEFDSTFSGVSNKIQYEPKTDEGKKISAGIGAVINTAVDAAGTAGYYTPKIWGGSRDEQDTGRIVGKVAANVALVLAPFLKGKVIPKGVEIPEEAPTLGSLKNQEKGMYENFKDPSYVGKWAQENYPETVKNLQASSVGKVMRNEHATVDVYNKVHSALNSELELKAGGGKSLTEKMTMYMDKVDPNKTMPDEARTKLISSTIAQLDDLNKVANAHLTPKQLVAARTIRAPQTTIEAINRMLNVKSPKEFASATAASKADMKAALSEVHGYVIDPVTQIERPLTAGEYLKMQMKSKSKAPVIIPEDPSGVYVIDEASGDVKRMLTVDEYMDTKPTTHDVPKILPVDAVPPAVSRITQQPVEASTGKPAGIFENLDTDPKIAKTNSQTVLPSGMLKPERFDVLDETMNRGYEAPAVKGTGYRKFLDVAGPLKSALAEQGKAGEFARDIFSLTNKSSGMADVAFRDYAKPIWEGLNFEDGVNVDKIARMRRIVQIDQYKGTGHKHLAGTNGLEAEAWLNTLKSKLGDEKYKVLNERADKLFRATRDELDFMHNKGLITDESYLAMRDIQYLRTEVIDHIDPRQTFTFGGKSMTVRDSGIPELGGGNIGAVEMNSKLLLQEIVARSRARAAKNDANVALRNMAIAMPENPFVRAVEVKEWDDKGKALNIAAPPKGWQRIDTLIGGKQHPMFMKDDMAEQWVTAPTEITSGLAQFLRTYSGTSMLKAAVTGLEPFFAPLNLIRDVGTAWTNSPAYSSHLPVYLMQLGKDISEVASDVIFRKGLAKEYQAHGGMLQIVTGGRAPSYVEHLELRPETPWTAPMKALYRGLTYASQTSEGLIRVALMKRAMKNGLSIDEAVAQSNNYRDSTLHGSYTKAVDTVLPFINDNVQIFHSAAKQISSNPARFAWQGIQGMGLGFMAAMAAMHADPEGWSQLDTKAKIGYINIPLPWMAGRDPQGNPRHYFARLKLESMFVPFNAAAVALAEHHMTGKIPDKLTLSTIQGTVSQLDQLPAPPVLSAMLAGLGNYDVWQMDKIYKGKPVNPSAETIPGYMPNSTEGLWDEVAQATNTSPIRDRAAMQKLLGGNTWLHLAGTGMDLALNGATPYQREEMTQQLLATESGLGRVLHSTSPMNKYLNDVNQAEKDQNTKEGKYHKSIEMMIFREGTGDGKAKDMFRTWIENQPAEDRGALTNKFVNEYVADKIFKQLKTGDGVPPKDWWTKTMALDGTSRAFLFHKELTSRPVEQQQQMLRIAGSMPKFGKNYMDEAFVREYAKESAVYGTNER
jgi:hypothetical protein